jgi:transposase-like protein
MIAWSWLNDNVLSIRCLLLRPKSLSVKTGEPQGLWHGATENATVVRDLLADLVERGLDTTRPTLVIMDGAKALRKAVGEIFGSNALVQRCRNTF